MTILTATRRRIATGLALTLLSAVQVSAQGTAADYRRAFDSRQRFSTDLVTGYVANPRWESNSSFRYSLNTGATWVDISGQIADDGTVSLDLTSHHERRRHQSSAASRATTFTNQRHHERHWMEVDDECRALPVPSPDSSLVAFIRNDNVYVALPDGSNPRALTTLGTLSHYFSAYLRWSPDGRYIAADLLRPIDKRYVYYVESSPSDQLQPLLHKQEYAKPGDELMQRTPYIISVATGKAVCPEASLIANQYDLSRSEWRADGAAIRFDYNQRGHKLYRVYEMDTLGHMRTLIEERAQTYVRYPNYYRRSLRSDSLLLWLSERDGFSHLYLFDLYAKAKGKAPTEASHRQLTAGSWCVRRVLHVDEEQGHVIFTANGRNADEDPYNIHYYLLSLRDGSLRDLTPEPGNHDARFNEAHTILLDLCSTPTTAPVFTLRDVDGHTLTAQVTDSLRSVLTPHSALLPTASSPSAITLAQASLDSLRSAGWQAPEVFVAPGRDGHTPMWGLIQRPSNFDPTKSYPIIEYIYAGPGDSYVPKSFSPWNYYLTPLAELGFIVVQLDAMGTSNRGKAFEEVCYKNLRDAGFPDRMEWIRAAARQYPYMDISRVGIFGCSAGGQESTAAVLFHGDFYKAAFSACGCHDNRMDKIWWNELWMGYPVDSSYVASSNVANAYRLERPLMLLVGELDDNVDPASTLQVADALIRAGKDFDLVVMPGLHHTMGGDFGDHKRFDFFVRHLLGATPPAWNAIPPRDDVQPSRH